jgi:nucleotide sugar dehydrogenase
LVQSIAVVGLGYVGLPLALAFHHEGHSIIGIDLDRRKLDSIRQGKSYLPDIEDELLSKAVNTGRFDVTEHFASIAHADVVLICVPTPLNKQHTPDLSYLIRAGTAIAEYIRQGHIIVLESSTYPGTTNEILRPMFEEKGLMVGEDYYLGYSPERIDPGNREHPFLTVPKIVSGVTEACVRRVSEVYDRVFDQVVPVSSTEAAELAKLLENSYRFVNISFINEFAILCDRMNVDVWEVIAAAGTKPYGFSAFYPGPGIGGHCIPVDPLYLQWKAKESGMSSTFIEASTVLNERMPSHIVKQVQGCLPGTRLEGSRILVVGVAYKKNINDVRESAALEILQLLAEQKSRIAYHDPFVPSLALNGFELRSVELTERILEETDCVILATEHSKLPIPFILDHAPLVYDTRNLTKGLSGKAKVVRFGGGGRLYNNGA